MHNIAYACMRTSMSVERVRKLQLFHACALYEAGKQHREVGDWGAAKKCFDSASNSKALPPELKMKNTDYLDECEERCDDIEDLELEGATMKRDRQRQRSS